jgi:hypothetical protein
MDGTISQWDPNVKPSPAGTGCYECHVSAATVMVNKSGSHASYLGLTLATYNGSSTYYAANANGGVEAYSTTFQPVTLPAGAFTDSKIPARYTPAGIQSVGKNIYVTFNGSNGGGYVDAFNPGGTRLLRLHKAGSMSRGERWRPAISANSAACCWSGTPAAGGSGPITTGTIPGLPDRL